MNCKADSASERLWLVSNLDGTREIVSEQNKDGRAGFAPAYGQTYGQVLAEMVKSLERESLSWLQTFQAYKAGLTRTEGPLGGPAIPAIAFVAGAHTYTAYIGTHHKGRFLGFGGRLAKVTMADGTTYESNNVWSGRDVPPHLRPILADNATLTWDYQ